MMFVFFHFGFDILILFRATSLFLASKVEENRLDVYELIKRFDGVAVPEIMKLELVLLSKLKFHLNVYHPFKSLLALREDLLQVTILE